MTLSIVADENIPAVEALFGHLGPVRRVDGRKLSPAQLRGTDVLLVRSVTRVDGELLRGSGIRFVGTATSGVDHVDRDYLSARGIGFASAPGSNANSVVEYVLAAIAAVSDWLERLLRGARVGIVGYGAIGRTLAARLEAMGIEFVVSDPWLEPGVVPHAVDLKQVLACEVVTLHPELTRRQPWPSYHLLGPSELASMHAGQLLINASRGAVVDGRALLQRLGEGDGPAAVLDVWEGEPGVDADLAAHVRLCSAHIAGYSLDGKLRGTRMLSEALSAYLGQPARAAIADRDDRRALAAEDDNAGAALIRHLIRARYDILLDDALFRASLEERDPAAAFDRLRRDYRVRREVAGSEFSADRCSEQQLATAVSLGCRPRPGDDRL